MKTRRVLLILAGLLALLLAIPPMLDPEHRSLEEARAQAGGSYAVLPLGSVHYQLSGSEAADPIVLVPGFSVPLFTYDRVYDALAQEHRVLRYDHYGRGLSERLDQPHDLDLLVGQHDMPTLLFWGDQDAVLPYRNHERLLADVPGTQVETMPGSGHTPQHEDPERFLARFFAFVGG